MLAAGTTHHTKPEVVAPELGLDPATLQSPWVAASSSFLEFALGAALPVIPFLFGSGTAPQPRGLRNIANVNEVSQGTNGAVLTSYDPILDLLALLWGSSVTPEVHDEEEPE